MVVPHCFQHICHCYVQRIMELHPPPSSVVVKTPSTATKRRHRKNVSSLSFSSFGGLSGSDNEISGDEGTDLSAQMALKKITPLNSSVIIEDIKLLVVRSAINLACIATLVCAHEYNACPVF